MNKYYNYGGIELWENEPWEERASQIGPLIRFIHSTTQKLYSDNAPESIYKDRTDGYIDPKNGYVVLQDKIDEIEKKGLHFRAEKTASWNGITFVPDSIYGKTDTYPKVLAVFNGVNYENKFWAMDMLDRYSAYIDAAAKEQFVLFFLSRDGFEPNYWYTTQMEEIPTIFHFNYDNLYLDLSAVMESGYKLSTVPGYRLMDTDDNIIPDPDSKVVPFSELNIPSIPIDGLWGSKKSLIHLLINSEAYHDTEFSRDAFIHSETGRRMKEWLDLEYNFRDYRDPRHKEYWDKMGIQFDDHFTKGTHWVTLSPKEALEHPEVKMPLVVVFQEVQTANKHHTFKGLSYCWEYANIAAQGEFIMLECALETSEDNYGIWDYVEEAIKLYPIDETRIYATGHSHNGTFSFEFARHYHDKIAAVATMGNPPGIAPPHCFGWKGRIDDLEIFRAATYDLPLINLFGYNESSMTPINDDAKRVNLISGSNSLLGLYENRVESWQRRLVASRCPVVSEEAILATKNSPDKCERMFGFPCDKTEVLWMDGFENYIGDIKNYEGKYHLREVALGGMPHTTTPLMLDLAWSFMRRFKRDLSTGEIIELY